MPVANCDIKFKSSQFVMSRAATNCNDKLLQFVTTRAVANCKCNYIYVIELACVRYWENIGHEKRKLMFSHYEPKKFRLLQCRPLII